MIELEGVSKRYQADGNRWVLRDIDLMIPAGVSVGIVGANGAGKSTLLRLIGGIDHPCKGQVRRHCRVSWPMGFGGGLQGSLTGRQNARFVCRIHGRDQAERVRQIEAFAELGEAFDRPVRTYSSGMKSRLQFAMSLAFDFDVYISDEITATGDAAFRAKAAAAFRGLADRASILMVSHGEDTLKEFCSAGIWVHEGQAIWFDRIDDALKNYKESYQ